MAKTNLRRTPKAHALPLFLLLLCVFLWSAVLSRNANDWPNPQVFPHNDFIHNACGKVGAWVAHHSVYWIGDGVYPALLFTTLLSFSWLLRGTLDAPIQRVFGASLIIISTSVAVALISNSSLDTLGHGAGGVLGAGLANLAMTHFSMLGAVLILVYVFFVGVAFAATGWSLRLPDWKQLRTLSDTLESVSKRIPRIPLARPVPVVNGNDILKSGTGAEPQKVKARRDDRPRDEARHSPDKDSKDPDPPTVRDSTSVSENGGQEKNEKPQPATSTKKGSTDNGEGLLLPVEKKPAVPSANSIPRIKVHHSDTKSFEEGSYPKRWKDWDFPPISLLDDSKRTVSDDYEMIVRAKAKTLERTLEDFRINAQVVQIDTGPVITMYELQLAAGIKVSQIASLSNDIARALKASSVRVVAPIPGKSTVGIEVPNPQKQVVRIKELLLAGGKKLETMALPLLLGQDASGNPLIADLTAMPHLMIAGTTGSGKSVCINSIVASFIMTQRPDELKLIMVDPKMVELTQFKDLPHLMSPIVTDVRRAEVILEWAVTKMEERYALLAEARVRTIRDYNALGEEELMKRLDPSNEEEKKQIPKHLPYIVIVIDELADLMMTSAKTVEHHLCRLAQKSRAVGIHIIVATQRPEAKVVTGLIKSNLPCRIAFRVASRLDSRIVLDQNGAEMLMGQGDMLFLPPGSAKLVRAQGTYVSDRELHAVLDNLKEKAQPEFHHELVRLTTTEAGDLGERDPMFDDAVRVVLETGRGSVSLIQRRLAVGFSRASRLIDQMADAGIVGTYKGSQAREVQMTLEEYEAIRKQAALEEGLEETASDSNANAGES